MIHAEVLNRAGIDYRAGLERFLNDSELYETILTAFSGENLIEKAEAAYNAGDRSMLFRVAHEAKGVCGNVGLDRAYAEACALVSLLRSTSYTDEELNERYLRFIETYAAARTAIRAALE